MIWDAANRSKLFTEGRSALGFAGLSDRARTANDAEARPLQDDSEDGHDMSCPYALSGRWDIGAVSFVRAPKGPTL